MLDRLAFFIADFWYSSLAYFLGTTYLLLAISFFRRRVLVVNALIFILAVWQIGFGFELYFRYIYDATDSFNFLLTSQRWEQRHIKNLNQLIGSEQFRDSKDWREPKQPKELKIAVVGDSIAYGIGIENPADRFPDLLEIKLNQAGLAAKVYNFSRPGNDLVQARTNFDRVVEAGDFNLIVWQLFPNDVPAGASPDVIRVKDLLHGQKTNPLLRDLLDRSYAFNFFYFHTWGLIDNSWSKHLAYQLQVYDQEGVWLEGGRQITEMIGTTKKKKIKLIAVLFPYVELIGPNYPALPHQKMAEVFNQKQVAFIDLLEDYRAYPPRELKANRFDSHPGELGHRLAAEAVFEKVKGIYQIN